MSYTLAFAKGVTNVKKLQQVTGKSFNECSYYYDLAGNDVDAALKLMKKYPTHYAEHHRIIK